MRKHKTKTIQTDLGIYMHILAYSCISRHNQAYSDIFRNYSGIGYSEPEANLEPFQTSTMEHFET